MENVNYNLVFFSVIFLVAIICITIIANRAFKQDADATSRAFRTLVRNGNGVRLAAVFTVIIGVIFLALAEKLDQGIIALLSSIAGYTLGGLRIEKKEEGQQ